jgi:hypothetical protein
MQTSPEGRRAGMSWLSHIRIGRRLGGAFVAVIAVFGLA